MKRKNTRREFVGLGLKAGIGIPLIGTSLLACHSEQVNRDATSSAKKKLKILILGGTSFLGPHLIAYAQDRGHTLTTFTRGKTKPTVHQDRFKDVESLIGDRSSDLTALHNRNWDVVIDNSGHDVNWTTESANLLKESCDLYLYTSSTGVYYPYLGRDFKEDDEVLLVEPEEILDEEMKMEYWYGVMKANSELSTIQAFGAERSIIVRPTYMIGPADKSNRFIHWPIRLSRGGEILVPGTAEDKVQYVDVRDVAEWMIRLIEEKKTGTFNAVGPSEEQSMYTFIDEAAAAFDVEHSFLKVDDFQFLKDQNIYHIVPWIMPEGNNVGSALINNQKAKANGLTFRPLKTTMMDTHDWWVSENVSQSQRDKVELDLESVLGREKLLIESWRKKVG